MRKKSLTILGSTGSIGTQTLDIVRQFPDHFSLSGISGFSNIKLVAKQANEFKPPYIAIPDNQKKQELLALLTYSPTIFVGKQGLIELTEVNADILLVAIIGTAALAPVAHAIPRIPHIAIANKEVLVAAGSIIMAMVRKYNTTFIPVDSEHSALFQCLEGIGFDYAVVNHITLTASGGPFRDNDPATFSAITTEKALKHPNWDMGAKITIDSATMANKGLEVIEAHHLFDLDFDDIKVVVHPQSIVHAIVETIDGAMFAHMGRPDMRYPIQYALTYPTRLKTPFKQSSLTELSDLTFLPPKDAAFPILGLAYDCGKQGGVLSTVFNAANELAVNQFLNKQIKFTDIYHVIESKIEEFQDETAKSIDDIIELDKRIKS